MVAPGLVDATLLKGARNFRAVMPYVAADGRRLRADILFRSGELSRLTEADLLAVERLNIRLVCDLRTDREQAEYMSRWPEQTGHKRLDLPDRDESDAGPHKIFELIAANPDGGGAVRAMNMLYRRKPRAYAKALRALFETIIAGDALPLLIHCHAGKDRTGFVIAMLLKAAGISDEDIIADYVMTSRYFPVDEEARFLVGWAQKSFGQVIGPVSARPMVEARRDYIEAAFQEIATGWDGATGYLRKAVGLTETAQIKFQDIMLEKTST